MPFCTSKTETQRMDNSSISGMAVETGNGHFGISGSDNIRAGRTITIAAFFTVLLITSLAVLHPMVSWSFFYYAALIYLLLTHSKAGLVLLVLSYHLVMNSYAAITGNYHSLLFYGVFIAAALIMLYANFIGFRFRKPSLTMDKYILVMILYLLYSILFITPDPVYGGEKLRYYITNVIIFYLPVLLVKKHKDLIPLIKGVLVFGFFFTGFSLLSYFGMEPFFGRDIAGRFSTLGLNTIWVARHLTYAILAELFFIKLYMKEPFRNIGKIGFLTILIIVQLYLAFLTGSRGPLLSVIVALAFIFIISTRFRLFHLIILGLVLIIVLMVAIQFLPADIADRLLSRDPSSQLTVHIRLVSNLKALSMFWENKIWGAGLGSFRIFDLRFPHNVFSETLAELGLIGFAIFMSILLTGISYLIKIRKKIDLSQFYFIIAVFITSLVNINFGEHIGSNFYLYFSFGLMYAARSLSLKGESDEEDIFLPWEYYKRKNDSGIDQPSL